MKKLLGKESGSRKKDWPVLHAFLAIHRIRTWIREQYSTWKSVEVEQEFFSSFSSSKSPARFIHRASRTRLFHLEISFHLFRGSFSSYNVDLRSGRFSTVFRVAVNDHWNSKARLLISEHQCSRDAVNEF